MCHTKLPGFKFGSGSFHLLRLVKLPLPSKLTPKSISCPLPTVITKHGVAESTSRTLEHHAVIK